MSHVAEVKLKVLDLDALADACATLGGEFRANQHEYKWYGRWMNDWSGGRAAVTQGHDPKTFGRCDHAIALAGQRGAYEVGLVPALDGVGYDLLYDSWGGGGQALERAFGKDLERLKVEYGAQVAMRQLAREGYGVSRTTNERGEVQVVGFKY